MLDTILNAAVDAVKRSGLLESIARMGTVSALHGSNGTVDVTRPDGTYLGVRVLSSYPSPAVGDRVIVIRTMGGWVCVGKVLSTF